MWLLEKKKVSVLHKVTASVVKKSQKNLMEPGVRGGGSGGAAAAALENSTVEAAVTDRVQTMCVGGIFFLFFFFFNQVFCSTFKLFKLLSELLSNPAQSVCSAVTM